MGFGKQAAPAANLDKFLAWADKAGYRIGEHPRYGGVSNVHSKNSWHYDGLAADINWGAPGIPAGERDKLSYAIQVADSLGLGHIYALNGTVGSAAQHKDHLHVDCGPTKNLGKGLVNVSKANMAKFEQLTGSTSSGLKVDGKWGPATTNRLQRVLGTPADGVVSGQSSTWKKANPGLKGGWQWVKPGTGKGSTVIRAVQKKIKVAQDGKIGPDTIKALQKYLGTTVDGVVSDPSRMVKALQTRLNQGKF